MTPEQVELHRMVIKHIEAEPERWSQSNWISGSHTDEERAALFRNFREGGCIAVGYQDFLNQEADVTQCGTTMCYAGWAVHLSGFTMTNGYTVKETGDFVGNLAKQLLGLTDRQADDLFDATAASRPKDMKRLVTRVTGITFD
jgi:hypothetical protein